jgi:catechol 2,3-dioxygenase-like lactoylglutathione lyase family enzyme
MAPKVRFMYSGIRVRSLARSIRFYRGLGFRIVKKGRFSHGGKWVHLAHPSSPHRIELNYYPKGTPFYEPFRPGTEFDHFGFFVSDPQQRIRQAVKAGGRPMTAFVEGPCCWLMCETRTGFGSGAVAHPNLDGPDVECCRNPGVGVERASLISWGVGRASSLLRQGPLARVPGATVHASARRPRCCPTRSASLHQGLDRCHFRPFPRPRVRAQ